MKLNMKWLSVLAMLAVLLTAPALAATARPVLVLADYKVAPGESLLTASPGPLMPGDTGTVVVTITNTFKGSSAGSTSSQSDTYNYGAGSSNGLATPSHSSTTTTQTTDLPQGTAALKLVSLQDSGPVHVVSQSYANPGSLGTGDSARFEFTISADSTAAPGKYYLPLTVKTDDDSVYLNQLVPVVVDDSGVRLVVNDAPKTLGTSKSSVVLDVINYLPGGVNAVSVTPSGNAFTFKPVQEYTVGSIGAGEMYTVTFDVAARNASYSGSPSFIVKYKNGDNWHQWGPVSLALDSSPGEAAGTTSDGSGLLYLLGGIVVLAVIVGGLFLFMRGQRAKK